MSILGAPAAIGGSVLDPIQNFIKNPFSRSAEKPGAPDFPEGFQIFEFIDNKEPDADKPTLRLTGNMLPMIPFEFGGEQRLVKDYYAGHPEPAVQVLGPKEGATVIRGKLKDKKYKDPKFDGVSYAIADALDKMRIRGNLLRITLGPWQRYAFLEKSTWKLNRLCEIEYELDFFVVGFEQPKNGKFATKSKLSPEATNQELIDAASDWAAEQRDAEYGQSVGDLLNGYIGEVAAAVALVTNFVDTVITQVEDVQKAANRAIGLIKHARSTISRFRRRIGNINLSIASLSSEGNAAARFQSAINSQANLKKAATSSITLSQLLARLQAQFSSIAKQVPAGRHRVRDGDTLQKIAMRFYKRSDDWKKIYDHNNLSSTKLTVGAILEIPRL
jgi:nucleoid-associated protein YgaU